MAAEKPTEPKSPEPKKAVEKKADTLVVVAPLVAVKDRNGASRQLYAGDIVPEGTAKESIDHLVDLGFIASK